MSTPADDADTLEEQGQDARSTKANTFADRVNDVVKSMVKDAEGNWEVPKDKEVPEEVRFAALAEKRYRDTQGAYTKVSQENKALVKTNSVLLDKAVSNVTLKLTPEQKEELEDLKFENPDEWRRKMNVLEAAAIAAHKAELDEDVKKVASTSLDEDEIERRKQVTKDYLNANPDFKFDNDVWQNDIPPRINNKLKDGKISFEEFLSECHNYLKTGKVIKQDDVTNDPNLSRVGGSSRPDDNAVKEDAILSYAKEAY